MVNLPIPVLIWLDVA